MNVFTQELAQASVKSAPAVAVTSTAWVTGMSMNHLVQIGTIVATLLTCIWIVVQIILAFRKDARSAKAAELLAERSRHSRLAAMDEDDE